MGSMLWLIAHISLVLAPVALLVLFQLKFLPYHDAITWWHRLAIFVDLALLWVLWPAVVLWPSVPRAKTPRITWRDIRVAKYAPTAFVRLLTTLASPIAHGRTRRSAWRVLRRGKVVALALASLLLTSLVFTIATYPGEWVHDNWPAARFIPTKWLPTSTDWTSPHELLFAGDPNETSTSFAPKTTSLLSNHLILPNLPVIDYVKFDSEAKIMALPDSIYLRDRHFEKAVLTGANLRNANLRGAFLKGAFLGGAQLQGANLDDAQLQGATLDRAQLQGASLVRAQLQDARLAEAKLQGATLLSAQLQGAWLDHAELQGASLKEATLWDAVLSGAALEGASLDGAQLQGARLDGANLQGASLQKAFVWRADYPGSWAMQDTLGDELETEAEYRSPECESDSLKCNWPPRGFVGITNSRLVKVPSNDEEINDDKEKMEPWEKFKRSNSPPNVSMYAKRLVIRLIRIGCDSKGGPYVIRQLAVRMQGLFEGWDPAMPAELASAFLDDKKCLGAHSLPEKDKAELRDIKNRAPSPSSEPTVGQQGNDRVSK
jgi:hypothetical protein